MLNALTGNNKAQLLPPNHSEIQSNILNYNDLEPILGQGISLLKGMKSHPHDKLKPWLVWEYGLGALVSYIDNLDDVLQEGLTWQRIRGTKESLKMALNWLDFSSAKIEESDSQRHFYRYQIHLQHYANLNDVEKITQLAELSNPCRAKLSRITYQLDIRELKLSHATYGALLSDQSGIRYRLNNGELVRISSLRKHQSCSHASISVKVAYQRKDNCLFSMAVYPKLGAFKLSAQPKPRYLFSSSHNRVSTRHYKLGHTYWSGGWQAQSWLNHFGPQVIIKHQGLS